MSERLPLISRYTLGGRVMALLGMALLFTLIVFSSSVFLFVNRTESDAWRNRQREAARSADSFSELRILCWCSVFWSPITC